MHELSQGPHVGDLLPDFSLRLTDGRQVHRRDLKGRHHAVIAFLPGGSLGSNTALLRTLAAHESGWRAARAAVLIVLPAGDEPLAGDLPFILVLDREGALRRRFEVGPQGALIMADLYGEVVLRLDDAAMLTPDARGESPLDQVLPTLGLLEMRCSL